MKKTLVIIGIILLTGVGVYCYKNIYTLWMPIGDATMVSYNHELIDNATLIYCPQHSAVEAAMDGTIMSVTQHDDVWEVSTYNQRTGLTAVYDQLDTILMSVSVKQGDTIGYTGNSEYLNFKLLQADGNDTIYLNAAVQFDKNYK